jgi:membrane peptidoglycan carboxypeptidase
MSEQFSVIMERAGRMVRGDSDEYPAAGRRYDSRAMMSRGSISVPPALAASDALLPYRRSRSRMVARKWRLRRVRGNPAAYFAGVFLLVLFVSALVGGGGAGGAFAAQYYQANQGRIRNAWISGNNHSTEIFDRNGQLLYALQRNTGFQFNVPYNLISPTVIEATVAVEDRTFFSNAGFDLYGTARALYADLTHGGSAQQGGSTITQQLVKQLVLQNDDKNLSRKLDEAILAIGMTKDNHFDPNGYTKPQIMQMYLNNIYYDDQNTGIEAAARNYFGYQPITDPKTKNVVEMANQQLTLAQIAVLVRIPNYPTLYYPLSWSCKQAPCAKSVWYDPNAQGNEWNVYNGAFTVLDNMRIAGYISQDTETTTLAQIDSMLTNEQIYHWKGLSQGTTNSEESIKKAPHFVDYVINQLIQNYGMIDPDTVAAAGLAVYTTLDYNFESYLETDAAMYINGEPSTGPNPGMFTRYWYCNTTGDNGGENNDPCTVPALKNSDNVHNAAAVAIDPHTGDILAMMGSVDYGSLDKQVLGYINMATTSRSMGSSFKPFVYATAFQMGWYPGLMLQDIPVCFPGQQSPPQPNTKWIPDPAAPACTTADHMGQYYTAHDYDATSFSGSAPIREMLANSLNIPATEAQYFIGANGDVGDGFLQMLGRLGIPTCASCNSAGYISGARLGPTTALGTQEIPLLAQTSGYGAFATGGLYTPPRAILRVDDSNGNTIYTAPTPHLGQAISPEAAYMITSILTDNIARAGDFKQHNPLYLPYGPNPLGPNPINYPYIAAKTGTAQGDTGPSGIVTMAYSPYMVMGVWAGNTDPHDDLNPNIIGITGAGYIVHDAMAWAVQKYHWPLNQGFAVPPDMSYAQFNCTDGLAPYKGTDLSAWQFDWNNQGRVTPSWCRLQPFPGYPNSTNLYDGYQTGGIKPDIDWIIKGQFPLVS